MDELIRDMREAADVILALPPYSRAIVSPAVQLAVMAQKAADELEKRRWIPVEERLPGPFESVLLSIRAKTGYGCAVTYETIGTCTHGKWSIYTGAIRKDERVTHWMPLPSIEGPPEEDKP